MILNGHVRRIAAYCCLVLVPALGLAYYYRWFAEDAFISARYARNLVEGNGLVFNVGERVEGYTNFLWTLLLAGGLRLGFTVETTGILFGLVFTFLSLLCLIAIHRQLFPDSKPLFPVAIVAIGLNYTWASFSTSGMETSLLCFLLIFSAYLLLISETSSPSYGRFFLLGIVGALLLMTRPDTIFFHAVLFLYLAFFRPSSNRKRELLLFLIPLGAVYIPYFFWRLSYYGLLLPNTFYAKSGDLSHYRQGIRYLWRFVGNYTLWAWSPLFVYFAYQIRKSSPRNRILLLLFVYCVLHIAWVVRIGGDFMDGRFFVVVLPFIYIFLEIAIRQAIALKHIQIFLLVALVVSSAVYRPVAREYRGNITDEGTWADVFELWRREGEIFRKYLPPSTLIATDGIGAFGYSSRLPIVDTLGLTDPFVARLPLKRRGAPGHEKFAPIEYLETRKVDILRDGMQRIVHKQLLGSFSGYNYYLMSDKSEIPTIFPMILTELQALERSSPSGSLPGDALQSGSQAGSNRQD